MQSNLLWGPDELTDAMVEVRGEEAENQISEEKDFGNNQDVLADRPHAFTLAQSTLFKLVEVDKEELKRNVHALINCRPNDTKVPIEQEFAIVIKDVPSLFDHICILGDFSVKIILKQSRVGCLQVLGGRMRRSLNKLAVLLNRDLLQCFLIVVFFRGLGGAYVVFSLKGIRLRHE